MRYKLLLIRDVDAADPMAEDPRTLPYVAVDLVGSGEGEIVLVSHGGAARIDAAAVPTDAAIVAIVDSARLDARNTFTKR